jgi:hypothetical protein
LATGTRLSLSGSFTRTLPGWAARSCGTERTRKLSRRAPAHWNKGCDQMTTHRVCSLWAKTGRRTLVRQSISATSSCANILSKPELFEIFLLQSIGEPQASLVETVAALKDASGMRGDCLVSWIPSRHRDPQTPSRFAKMMGRLLQTTENNYSVVPTKCSDRAPFQTNRLT